MVFAWSVIRKSVQNDWPSCRSPGSASNARKRSSCSKKLNEESNGSDLTNHAFPTPAFLDFSADPIFESILRLSHLMMTYSGSIKAR